jgi:hypothetical protein
MSDDDLVGKPVDDSGSYMVQWFATGSGRQFLNPVSSQSWELTDAWIITDKSHMVQGLSGGAAFVLKYTSCNRRAPVTTRTSAWLYYLVCA